MVEITVGVIAKNERKYIKDLMKSLLSQNFPYNKYEIILIDGDSKDGTPTLARDILKKGKVKYKIISEKSAAIKCLKKLGYKESDIKRNLSFLRKKYNLYGLCFARNSVVRFSSKSSRYIAFIDADCIADKNWLRTLYEHIITTSKNVAGCGGPRFIAKTNNKIELLLNSLLTSYIATGFNPAFSKLKFIKFVRSIPNYNAIYKKEILLEEPYDERLIISDDSELNFRLKKKGYKFIYVPNAKVYHHETASIKTFINNMFRYGLNISNVISKHKTIPRIYVPLTILLLLSPIFSITWYYILYKLNISSFFFTSLPLLFYFLYFIFILAVFVEVTIKTKDFLRSLLVFFLVPSQHISYALGILNGLIKRRYKNEGQQKTETACSN